MSIVHVRDRAALPQAASNQLQILAGLATRDATIDSILSGTFCGAEYHVHILLPDQQVLRVRVALDLFGSLIEVAQAPPTPDLSITTRQETR